MLREGATLAKKRPTKRPAAARRAPPPSPPASGNWQQGRERHIRACAASAQHCKPKAFCSDVEHLRSSASGDTHRSRAEARGMHEHV